ncbi:unnamed protein product [marine sediment metagenome]|uniref:Uncharacterized protein n=1 Tax=marine sediment metagenome TaxID=412755 RepID=X1VM78_9ZZZZ
MGGENPDYICCQFVVVKLGDIIAQIFTRIAHIGDNFDRYTYPKIRPNPG